MAAMRRKQTPAAQPAAKASVPSSEGTPPDDRLEDVRKALEAREGGSDIVVSIPIWGWTGDGKTCALLTALHYCDPALHLLALALISDTDDLARMEASVEQYRGLNLAATAEGTTDRLRQLLRLFIDECQWPPGTDEASAYVVEARNMASRLGYVVFPDIRGGSFREVDDTAKEVLMHAHAAILLVNAKKYVEADTDGRRYRDEILSRLQHFARAKIPLCVMITKADKQPGTDPAIDKAHTLLTVAVERQTGLDAKVYRISISGGAPFNGKKPPQAGDRKPEQLVEAWTWIVGKALARPAEDVRGLLPSINLQGLVRRTAPLAAEALPELRIVGDFSNVPGVPLCATDDSGLAFLNESGQLFEATFEGGRRDPTISQVGTLAAATDEDLQGSYFKGEFVIGKRSDCNSVWQGGKGGQLSETPLPSALLSWAAVSARRIVGIDAAGRLHSCGLAAGKWTQLDYMEGLAAPSNLAVCAYSAAGAQVLVYTGDAVEVVLLGADGKFREKVAPAVVCKFNAPGAVTNGLGLCLAKTTAGAGILSAAPKVGELGALHPDTPLALAGQAPIAAAIDAQLHLTAFSIVGGKLRRTTPALSPILPALPTGLLWTQQGSMVIATFDDSTWGAYRPLALV